MNMEQKLDMKQGLVTNRVIHNVYTKGTFNDSEKDSYEPQYVMALSRMEGNDGENIMGICYFDISTFKCFIGTFVDDESNSVLRTAIVKIRPVELIYDKGQMTKD